MTAMKGDWVVNSGEGPEALPEWLRMAFVKDDGEVYMPAEAMWPSPLALMMATYDGVECFTDDGHLFVPVSWARRERPESAEGFDRMVKVCRHAAGR